MNIKPLFVRCDTDRMVFEVNRENFEAKSCSCYDAYCFKDPRPDVDYISYSEWLNKKSELFLIQYRQLT